MDANQDQTTNRKKGKAPERLSELQVHGRHSKRRRTSPSIDTSSGIFPLDVWLLIADFIPTRDTQTLSVLTRVSKPLYQNLSSRLYRDLVVAATSHGNVRGFIEVIQRYLSIGQRQWIRAERLQSIEVKQPKYPDGFSETFIPYCTQYVKRLLVGWSNPGPDHIDYVGSAIEELLLNLTELEALVWLDNHIKFTEILGARLAQLKLKALVFNFHAGVGRSSVLSGIKNLAYLDILRSPGCEKSSGIKDLLLGSKDTLETLVYEEGLRTDDDPADSTEILLHEGEIIKFPKLATLCLRLNRLTNPEAKGLLSSIDFTHLTYFEFSTSKHSEDEDILSHHALFQALYDAYGPDSESKHLQLRTFRFRSRVPVYPGKTFIKLLASFDTLRTFIFEETCNNEGVPELEDLDGLISALSAHKGLQWLSIYLPTYKAKRWQFSKQHMANVRDNFPELTHLACSYMRSAESDIFSILPTMPKLVCFCLPAARQAIGWTNASPETQMSLIKVNIIPAFLRQLQNGSSDSKPRSWEDKYKLRLVMLGNAAFEIATVFPKVPKTTFETFEVKTEDGVVSIKRVTPQQLYDGEYPCINMMKAVEWRARNYDGSRGDWFQGIRL